MATRDTREEAELLAARLRKEYPAATFALAEQDGTRWTGEHFTLYHVVQVVACAECGGEVETIAYGEAGSHRCTGCDRKLTARIRAEHDRRAALSAAEVAWAEWFDRTDGLPGR